MIAWCGRVPRNGVYVLTSEGKALARGYKLHLGR